MDERSEAPPDPDAQRMLAVQAGDQVAFRELFQRFAPRLLAFVDRFFHNRAQSEELVQEIFLKLYRARHKYEVRSRFTTWLYTIATRTCLNELRRPGRRRPIEPLSEEAATSADPGASAQAVLEGRELLQQAQQVLDGLPENQRTALLLVRFGGRSYTEVSEILGVSESAVKSLVFRAAEALRKVVGPPGAGDRHGSSPVAEVGT